MHTLKRWIFTCCTPLLFAFRIPDLISPPLDPPFVERPTETRIEKKKIEYLEEFDPRTADEEYELGLLYILAGNLALAKGHIERAIQLKPNFEEAQIQMGFILIWQNQLNQAKQFFQKVLVKHPCDKKALLGLGKIAIKSSDKQAIELFQQLYSCDSKNTDALFTLGQLYKKTKQYEKAKEAYLALLKIHPNDLDAEMGLAQVYQQTKNYSALKDLSEKYPSNVDIQYMYARSLLKSEKYNEASEVYNRLPPNRQIWTEQWDVKSRSRVSTSVEANYTDAKESDPTLHVPVVKDYYFYGALNVFLPIFDAWRIDLKPFVYHQRENDILPPTSVNYNIYESGAQLISHYYFAQNWRWDLTLRGFDSFGSGQMNYPFQKTNRFEPGTSVVLNSEQFLLIDAHVESFIIKNFEKLESQLLRTDYAQAAYGYRPDIFLHPKGEANATWVYFHDSLHNMKNKQSLLGQMDLYFPWLTTFYLFEHSGFKYLNPNYYSYKRQIRNTIELRLHQTLSNGLYMELFWDHTWELTHNLFLPIGNFIYVAPQLYLIWNTLTAQVGYKYKDKLKFELGGHYLHNTLPYTDWNLRGSIIWQF
jgi:tetratricopeptide (TPR) repeat protein